MESHALMQVALDITNGKKNVTGFSIWSYNNEMEEHDMLEFLYTFIKYRKNHIAVELVKNFSGKVLLVNEPSIYIRKLLTTYYPNSIIGKKINFEWRAENKLEQEKIQKQLAKDYENMTTPFENFTLPKI